MAASRHITEGFFFFQASEQGEMEASSSGGEVEEEPLSSQTFGCKDDRRPFKKESDGRTQAQTCINTNVFTCSGEVAPSYRYRAGVVQRSSGNWTGVAMETGETVA